MLRSVEEFTETKLEETDAHGTGQLAAAFAAQVQQLDGLIRQQCWADICTLQLQQMERQQHQSESEDREVWSALLDTLNGVSFYFLLHRAGAGGAIAWIFMLPFFLFLIAAAHTEPRGEQQGGVTAAARDTSRPSASICARTAAAEAAVAATAAGARTTDANAAANAAASHVRLCHAPATAPAAGARIHQRAWVIPRLPVE